MDVTKTPDTRIWARRRLRLAALGLSSAAAIGLAVGMGPVQATDEQPAQATGQQPIQPTPEAIPQWQGYADLVEQVVPAVVSVTSTRNAGEQFVTGPHQFRGPEGFEAPEEFEGPEGEMFKRFMERFFGEEMPRGFRGGPRMPMPSPSPMAAAGSGFIVDDEGHVVTNNHVVEGADEVMVTLHDGRELQAEVVGTDPDTDLALLKVESDEPLPFVKWADSDHLRVGEPVVAIGNPFGLGGTVTAGILSADGRAIGAGRYDDFLQIDAPINRGNSGGPAFNLQGEVIGVNTAIHSPTGGNVGIGFAIPANLAQRVIADLEDDGMVQRGWLGVHIQSVDEDLAQALGLEAAEGAMVATVTPDSPAQGAGFEQGDVILRFAGTEVDDLRDLTRAVADTDPGTEAEVVVWRAGGEQTLSVEIGQMPAGDAVVAAAEPEAQPDGEEAPKLGVALARLSPEARAELELPADLEGVVVTDVQPGSPAAQKGLRRGDVIVEVDRQKVTEPKAVADAVRAAAEQGDQQILLLVKRDGQDRYVAVPVGRA